MIIKEAEAFSKNVLGKEVNNFWNFLSADMSILILLFIQSTDIPEIAKNIANMPKINAARKRIVIITQGDRPVVFSNGEEVKEYPIRKLKHEEIVDTNGAGDAFVG